MEKIDFQQVENSGQKEQAGALIREYLEWLNERVKHDYGIEFNVDAMVASDLSDLYKFFPPTGRFYLALYDDTVAGVGEVQRMYVRPAFRGKGLGRAVINRLVDDARKIGYRQLKLESLEFLKEAHSLYKSIGFREIIPYDDNSMKSYQLAEQLDQYYSITVFMEMDL